MHAAVRPYASALGCLRAGVSVLVEKPPAISLREFDDLAAVEGAGGRADWRDRWRAGAHAVAELTGEHLTEIGAGAVGHRGTAGLWRIDPSDGPRAYGMCGRLTTYPPSRAAQIA